jgi:transposase
VTSSDAYNLPLNYEDLLSEIALLRADLAGLRASHEALLAENAELRDENAFLRSEIARITGGGDGKSEKPSGPRVNPLKQLKEHKDRKVRKKRAQNFVRPRDKATDEKFHTASKCPDCGRGLCGGWEHDRRQIIDIPAKPVEITDHIIMARRCGVCKKRVLPSRDFSDLVVGKHRIGIRLMSLIAHLREVARVPIDIIRQFLKDLWGLTVSVGEIVALTHDVAKVGKRVYESIREEVRQSDFCHSDETGWRENGVGGELWSVSTPTARFFHRGTREARMIQEILRDYRGIVVCDFYAGYNYVGERRQRCWVHYIRDLRALREACAEKPDIVAWINSIIDIYRSAKRYQMACRKALAGNSPMFGYGVFDRRRARMQYEHELLSLARQNIDDAPDRQRVLAQRIENFLPELFTFVEFPNVPSDNNAAERAIRPAVIGRKICGGTRSTKGSDTKMILMTLMHTWKARGLSTIEQCAHMLATQGKPECATSY